MRTMCDTCIIVKSESDPKSGLTVYFDNNGLSVTVCWYRAKQLYNDKSLKLICKPVILCAILCLLLVYVLVMLLDTLGTIDISLLMYLQLEIANLVTYIFSAVLGYSYIGIYLPATGPIHLRFTNLRFFPYNPLAKLNILCSDSPLFLHNNSKAFNSVV